MIVDLNPTEEQQIIRDSIEQLLTRVLPMERLRESRSHGGSAERAAWSEMVQIGLFRFALTEASGGIGYGVPEEVVAGRAFGRHCVSPGVIATMLAAHVADATNDPTLRDRFIEGSAHAAFANPVGGSEVQVIDGEHSDYLLIPGDGLQLARREDALDVRDVESIDETLRLQRATLRTSGTQADLAGRGSLLLSAYLIGNARATLDMAVSYAGVREQFGQPIGAFQAIKHSCADMAVRVAAAEAQVLHTAAMAGAGPTDDAEIASARWLSGDAAVNNAKSNVQIHGGMGFTAECDAHHYLKRALVIASLGSRHRRERASILRR